MEKEKNINIKEEQNKEKVIDTSKQFSIGGFDEIALAVADYDYKQECDFIITIKGHYKNSGLTKEEAKEEIPTDCIWEYMVDNICNYYETAIIEKSNEKKCGNAVLKHQGACI